MQDTNSRIDVRIDPVVKQKAKEELQQHGLSITEYVRIVLTSLANEGLPQHFGLPNEVVMNSLHEAVKDLDGSHPLPTASNRTDLENMLDE